MEKLDKDSLYFIFLEVLRLHYYRTHMLLDKIGVYPGQPPLLFILNKHNGLSQKEIAKKLGIKPSTITVMLKRMESGNLVCRRQDSKDQRVSRVYITEEGRRLCEKSKELTIQLQDECFGNFTQEEKENLRRSFIQIRDNLQKEI